MPSLSESVSSKKKKKLWVSDESPVACLDVMMSYDVDSSPLYVKLFSD